MRYYVQWNNSPNEPVWSNVWIPVSIVKEYPKFYVAEVQPHKNPKGFTMSRPYTITLRKWDIKHGEVLLKQAW